MLCHHTGCNLNPGCLYFKLSTPKNKTKQNKTPDVFVSEVERETARKIYPFLGFFLKMLTEAISVFPGMQPLSVSNEIELEMESQCKSRHLYAIGVSWGVIAATLSACPQLLLSVTVILTVNLLHPPFTEAAF